LNCTFLWHIYTCNFNPIHASKQKLKCKKLKICIFFKFKRNKSVKNQWIITKFELDLHSPMMYPHIKFDWIWVAGSEEKYFKISPCIFTLLLLSSLETRLSPSFEQTCISFTNGWFVPSLVKIRPVVLKKIFKWPHHIFAFIWLIVCNFVPYSKKFKLYDGSQFLLVKERTQTHYTMCLGRDTDLPQVNWQTF
jgi:hypothetical protein